jgi:hypothetical protein
MTRHELHERATGARAHARAEPDRDLRDRWFQIADAWLIQANERVEPQLH